MPIRYVIRQSTVAFGHARRESSLRFDAEVAAAELAETAAAASSLPAVDSRQIRRQSSTGSARRLITFHQSDSPITVTRCRDAGEEGTYMRRGTTSFIVIDHF
jgi:hypothetical protein